MFSLEGREAEIIAVVLLTLLSAIKLTDDRVRDGGPPRTRRNIP